MGISPTSRSKHLLRELGYYEDTVERWIPGANIRKDLFGFADILGIHPEYGAIAVQATTRDNASKRCKKASQLDTLACWLGLGEEYPCFRFEVWGWGKIKKKRGGRATVSCRRLRARLTESGIITFQELGELPGTG